MKRAMGDRERMIGLHRRFTLKAVMLNQAKKILIGIGGLLRERMKRRGGRDAGTRKQEERPYHPDHRLGDFARHFFVFRRKTNPTTNEFRTYFNSNSHTHKKSFFYVVNSNWLVPRLCDVRCVM
jgi:hypothetical protein